MQGSRLPRHSCTILSDLKRRRPPLIAASFGKYTRYRYVRFQEDSARSRSAGPRADIIMQRARRDANIARECAAPIARCDRLPARANCRQPVSCSRSPFFDLRFRLLWKLPAGLRCLAQREVSYAAGELRRCCLCEELHWRAEASRNKLPWSAAKVW